jgi:hypothetical protein
MRNATVQAIHVVIHILEILMLFAALLLLPGCDLLEDARDELTDLTNPLVGQAMVIGIAEPENELVAAALENTDWNMGVFAQVFLADATSADDLSKAPVGGATVNIVVGGNEAIRLVENESGSYSASNEDGLVYQVGADVEVSVKMEGGPAMMDGQLPQAPDVELPAQQNKGAKMVVNLSGGNFNAVLGVVFDAETSEVVWSNEPTTPEELYDFGHSNEFVTSLEIPGVTFSKAGIYAVGIAGLVNGEADEFDNVNTLLSSFMAGKMSIGAVTVMPN